MIRVETELVSVTSYGAYSVYVLFSSTLSNNKKIHSMNVVAVQTSDTWQHPVIDRVKVYRNYTFPLE